MILRWLRAYGRHRYWNRSNRVKLGHLLALLLLVWLLKAIFLAVVTLCAFPVHEKSLGDDLEAHCAADLQ